ncbi:AbrB/MazE/SpoVT family DNA-binding domain-containing protein [Candidatus Bathyarchaeota archaeon]|nr:AbrB/MazE/SpoVT family DNA-binding domain-containing protein [Candidatus Bathyarchaeota archaeon]MBS7617901.1 AbrB/MazE/SpoVT family DNA-binding domain-containing protein [Candidatus Bathyarchaeota archaeon]
METVRVDGKGRIIIPKNMREKAGVKEGSYVKIRVDEKGIMIEPLKSIADKYFGAFKIMKWPEDLDEFIIEVVRKWWSRKPT